MRKSTLFLLLQVFVIAYGIRDFRLGRGSGGNMGTPGDSEGYELPPAQWFQQRLDHSSPTDLRTWKQRYFVNDTFFNYENQGPVFLMIGGEGPADPRWMVVGAWIEYAKRFNALCINLEHRYYGESHPTSDLSVKNLQYLSSSQALADLANFVTAMKAKYNLKDEVKWVAFGGSYPGSLAAWTRVKYPHLIHAAVSSSGPLLAKVNFKEYFQVVVEALREKTGSEECVNLITAGHKQIEKLMKTNPDIIEKDFKVCQPFSTATEYDIKNFYSSLADDFAGLVQYNEDNRFSVAPKYKNITINTVCNMLTAPGAQPAFKKLARFNDIILEKSNQTCLDYNYTNMIQEYRETSWPSEGARQWMYQTCTEFGFYQTSSAEKTVFGDYFTLDFFIKQCQDVFGSKFGPTFVDDAAQWTNVNYGGMGVAVSRVVFVHGSVDPWHALGIIRSLNNDAPAVFIKGTAHCANMYPPSDDDSSDLVMARAEVERYLSKWLNSE